MDSLTRCRELFNAGRFFDALEYLDSARHANRTLSRIQRIRILERLGRYDECAAMSRLLLGSTQLTSTQTGVCHYVLGSLSLDQGDSTGAIDHLQRSILFARQGQDLDLLCEAQIKLLGVVADTSGP